MKLFKQLIAVIFFNPEIQPAKKHGVGMILCQQVLQEHECGCKKFDNRDMMMEDRSVRMMEWIK